MSKETLPAEIAKQIPIKDIYDDVAHPALSEVGKAIQSLNRIKVFPLSSRQTSEEEDCEVFFSTIT